MTPMSHVMAYEREPYRRELETEVVEIGAHDDRPFAVLADTILYPEGGGQPADRGWLGDVAVTDVQRVEGTIRHWLAATVTAGPVRLRLDWARRFDHMQQHTAQHLLSAVAEDRSGWATTAFHLGEDICDVELDAASLGERQLAELEEAVAVEVRAARPVTARRVGEAELAALKVRTRGLPAGHSGDVRLVEIAGIDLNTCGGTHLRSTAEIEAVTLLGTEPMRGGTRVFFLAGGRLRRRLAAHESRNAALRAALGVPDGEIAEAVAARLEQVRRLEREARHLEEELASAVAEALAGRADAVVEAHFDDRDAAFLQRLARQLGQRAPGKSALFTAGGEAAGFFVLVAGEGVAEVAALGRQVAALLDGRGGGSGRLFQGKAGSLARRAEALATFRHALAGDRAT